MEETDPIGNHHHPQQHEISSEFEEGHSNPLLTNMGMFNRLLLNNNVGSLFMKNMENHASNGQDSLGMFETNRETTTTVDFLGLGPSEGHLEMMQLEGVEHHRSRVVGLNHPFLQPQVSSLEKEMWEG